MHPSTKTDRRFMLQCSRKKSPKKTSIWQRLFTPNEMCLNLFHDKLKVKQIASQNKRHRRKVTHRYRVFPVIIKSLEMVAVLEEEEEDNGEAMALWIPTSWLPTTTGGQFVMQKDHSGIGFVWCTMPSELAQRHQPDRQTAINIILLTLYIVFQISWPVEAPSC